MRGSLSIGRGEDGDFDQAIYWLKRSAAKNFARSQYTLGKLYADGLGVPEDRTKAFGLVMEAGRAGLAAAQYNLGKMYRDGFGIRASGITVITVPVSYMRQFFLSRPLLFGPRFCGLKSRPATTEHFSIHASEPNGRPVVSDRRNHLNGGNPVTVYLFEEIR